MFLFGVLFQSFHAHQSLSNMPSKPCWCPSSQTDKASCNIFASRQDLLLRDESQRKLQLDDGFYVTDATGLININHHVCIHHPSIIGTDHRSYMILCDSLFMNVIYCPSSLPCWQHPSLPPRLAARKQIKKLQDTGSFTTRLGLPISLPLIARTV